MTDNNDKDKRSFNRNSGPRDRKPFSGKGSRDGGKPGFRKDRPSAFSNKSKPIGVILPDSPEERIAKVIARAGIASRRDAEALIAEGRVTLDGEVLTSPAINVGPMARITIDGEPLPERDRTRLWLYHKPRGLVTTARDPEGRPTVFENLPEEMPRVISVGRLDINTEGLLLLTNDGGLARVIAHPETGWLRRYKVRAHGDITQADLDKLAEGITIDGIEYGPVEARLDRVQGDNAWITLGLREGKNREVKRILEYIGLSVNRLIRLSFGPFQLGDLESGLVEEVRTKVLKEQLGETLSQQANVDFMRPVREPVATHAPRRFDDDIDAEDLSDDPHAIRREKEMAKALERRDFNRAVWRSEELETRFSRKGKAPRRGDETREALAQRPRQRAKPIETDKGRMVRVERFIPRPDAEDRPRSRPQARPSDKSGFENRNRDFAPRGDRERASERNFERRDRPDRDREAPSRFSRSDDRPKRFSDNKGGYRKRDEDGGSSRFGSPRSSAPRSRDGGESSDRFSQNRGGFRKRDDDAGASRFGGPRSSAPRSRDGGDRSDRFSQNRGGFRKRDDDAGANRFGGPRSSAPRDRAPRSADSGERTDRFSSNRGDKSFSGKRPSGGAGRTGGTGKSGFSGKPRPGGKPFGGRPGGKGR